MLQARHLKRLAGIRVSYHFIIGDEIGAGKDFAGYRGKGVSKIIVVPEALPVNKNENIDCNQQVIDDWRYAPVPVIISYR